MIFNLIQGSNRSYLTKILEFTKNPLKYATVNKNFNEAAQRAYQAYLKHYPLESIKQFGKTNKHIAYDILSNRKFHGALSFAEFIEMTSIQFPDFFKTVYNKNPEFIKTLSKEELSVLGENDLFFAHLLLRGFVLKSEYNILDNHHIRTITASHPSLYIPAINQLKTNIIKNKKTSNPFIAQCLMQYAQINYEAALYILNDKDMAAIIAKHGSLFEVAGLAMRYPEHQHTIMDKLCLYANNSVFKRQILEQIDERRKNMVHPRVCKLGQHIITRVENWEEVLSDLKRVINGSKNIFEIKSPETAFYISWVMPEKFIKEIKEHPELLEKISLIYQSFPNSRLNFLEALYLIRENLIKTSPSNRENFNEDLVKSLAHIKYDLNMVQATMFVGLFQFAQSCFHDKDILGQFLESNTQVSPQDLVKFDAFLRYSSQALCEVIENCLIERSKLKASEKNTDLKLKQKIELLNKEMTKLKIVESFPQMIPSRTPAITFSLNPEENGQKEEESRPKHKVKQILK